MICLEKVSVTYHPGSDAEVRALTDVDLTIDRGESVAVVGANGSGKSTLAQLLNSLLLPTAGRVWVDGMLTSDPRWLWEIRRRVGMVFQNPDNQLVATTVEEDVAFGPENLGVPPDEIARRVQEALAAVGMEAYRHRAPHHLSGGQKQRVAIAGVLAMRPDVIVLDEPTAMLDPRGRKDVLETVRRLHREAGITVVYITHFMDEAAAADRVVVLERGRVARDAAPRQVFGDRALLERAGLEEPPLVRLAGALRRRGVPVPEDFSGPDLEALVDLLCRLRSSA